MLVSMAVALPATTRSARRSTEVNDMYAASDFMGYIIGPIQMPQGKNGTYWALMGASDQNNNEFAASSGDACRHRKGHQRQSRHGISQRQALHLLVEDRQPYQHRLRHDGSRLYHRLHALKYVRLWLFPGWLQQSPLPGLYRHKQQQSDLCPVLHYPAFAFAAIIRIKTKIPETRKIPILAKAIRLRIKHKMYS